MNAGLSVFLMRLVSELWLLTSMCSMLCERVPLNLIEKITLVQAAGILNEIINNQFATTSLLGLSNLPASLILFVLCSLYLQL